MAPERVIISLPSAEDEEKARRFQVHKNYLGNIALFLRHTHGSNDAQLLQSLIAAQRGMKGFQKIQRRPQADVREIKRCLAISWASELQLLLNATPDKSLLRYSTVWAPVHAYYAGYFSAHAWLAAMGMNTGLDDHTSTLRTIATQLSTRKILPVPWSFTCRGTPHIGETVFGQCPQGADPAAPCELLSNPSFESFWPRLGKMLETTRKLRLERIHREWLKQNNRKIVKTPEKRQIATNLPDTTLFDYLWRLRVRSNYQDVTSFFSTVVSDEWHYDFHTGLSLLVWTTLGTLESLILQYVGPKLFAKAVDEFVRYDAFSVATLTGPLKTRRDVLLG